MVSIIICTYNREKYLGETLERLAANVFDGEWELLLIDNNCTDSTPAICKAFAAKYPATPFRYVVEEKQGLSHARNRGMAEAKGDWLLFLDDDAFVEPDYLSRLNRYIDQLPDMMAFGGRIYPLFEDGKAPSWLCRWNKSWLSAIDKGDNIGRFEGSEFPIGANMGFRRMMYEACGGFDTTLGRSGKNLIGGEEKDYFNRIKARQGKIYYLPEIAVRHCIPPSRTTNEYIARLGDGVGMSEKMRTKERGIYGKRLVQEGIKWCATLVLWAGYACCGRVACGQSLVLFRFHVTKGLVK